MGSSVRGARARAEPIGWAGRDWNCHAGQQSEKEQRHYRVENIEANQLRLGQREGRSKIVASKAAWGDVAFVFSRAPKRRKREYVAGKAAYDETRNCLLAKSVSSPEFFDTQFTASC